MTLLKKTRIFWIYDIIITIFFSACYFVKVNPSGPSGLFTWAMLIGYQIGIFEVFIAGPFFAIKIQKNNLTTKELVWSTFLIFTITFITFCIPEFTLHQFMPHHWKVFLKQEIFRPFLIALIVSITYYITNIICKKVKKVTIPATFFTSLMKLLKKTRIFWIYDLIITIFFSVGYFVKNDPSGLLAWPMIMGYHQIGIFEVFIAGPFFATKIQKNNLTTKELVWSTFLIFTMTFITFCIPEFTLTQQFTLHHWKVFLEQKILFPLLIALIISITYYITNIICKKVKKVTIPIYTSPMNGGQLMMILLKKTRIFWIYDIIITIFFSVCYFLRGNPGGLMAWVMFIGYPIIIFEVFIAGPFFAIKIQKNNLTTKELVWSTFLIFTMTFITFCIPESAVTHWTVFLKQELFFPLSIALIVSITYYITNIICKFVKKCRR